MINTFYVHKQIKLWKINSDYNKKIAQNLEEALGIDQIISVLLSQRGITNYQEAKEFLDQTLIYCITLF